MFPLYSLAFHEPEEYKQGVSSGSSGRTDYDSTGLRAALTADHTAFAVRVARETYVLLARFRVDTVKK